MLLNLASKFYKQDDDTTVVADGFPVLNGLKEVHLLLSEGAHNQYGDLPWTARQEMMMEQAGIPRVSAAAHHGGLPRGMDGQRRFHETAPGLGPDLGAPLPQFGRILRAGP